MFLPRHKNSQILFTLSKAALWIITLLLDFLFQFSGVIGFIFFLELTAAVLAFVFQGQVREWINDFFLTNLKAYREDIDLQNLIDSLQKLVSLREFLNIYRFSNTKFSVYTTCQPQTTTYILEVKPLNQTLCFAIHSSVYFRQLLFN